MKFLVDRCVGRRLAAWLVAQGHDVIEAQTRHPDPGDRAILAWAAAEARVLVTMDKDFGLLLFGEGMPHAGLVRLPHVRPHESVNLDAASAIDARTSAGCGGCHHGARAANSDFPAGATMTCCLFEKRRELAHDGRSGKPIWK